MALTVKHSTVVVVPDDGTSPVGTDEWNASHTITGTIEIANGGTGSATAADARTALGVAASGGVTASGLTMTTARMLGRTTSGTGAIEEITVGSGLALSSGTLSSTTVTSVGLSGGTTGLTASGSPITGSGTITLGGTLAVANGGTGATNAAAGAGALLDGLSTTQGAILYRSSLGWVALSPGAAGSLLKSNGTGANPSWDTVDTPDLLGTASPMLSTDEMLLRRDDEMLAASLSTVAVALQDHPGYEAGGYTLLGPGAMSVSASAVTAGTLYLYLAKIGAPLTISELGFNVLTGSAGGAKFGVWANANGRPTGTPIMSDNTAVPSTASTGRLVFFPTSPNNTLPYGWVWVGLVCSGTPTFNALSANSQVGHLHSSTNSFWSAPSSAIQHVGKSIAITYSNNIGTLDLTSATLTDVGSSIIPFAHVKH